jgi:hypothetical protein
MGKSSMKTRGYGDTYAEKMLRKIDALQNGKNVTITLENSDKSQTNKQFIKHKVSGREYVRYMMGQRKTSPAQLTGE